MQYYLIGFVAAVFCVLVPVCWWDVCNRRTARCCNELIDAIFSLPLGQYLPFCEDYGSVKYEQQFYRRFRFGNWKALYPKRIRDKFPQILGD